MIDISTYRELHKDAAPSSKDELGEAAMGQDEPPNDPFVLLLPHRVHGFGIHDKKWRKRELAQVSVWFRALM